MQGHNGISSDLVSRWFLPLFFWTTHTQYTMSQPWLNPEKWGHVIRNTIPYSIFKTRLHLCLWKHPGTNLMSRWWCIGSSVACCDSFLINCKMGFHTQRRERSHLCHKSQCLSGRLQYPDWTCIRLSSTAEKERQRKRRVRDQYQELFCVVSGKKQCSSSTEYTVRL